MNVLSAGAVQKGLETAANSFEKETGQKISLTFATAPVIRSKVENQELALDLVIAPLESMREFEQRRLITAGSSAVVGSVKDDQSLSDRSRAVMSVTPGVTSASS